MGLAAVTIRVVSGGAGFVGRGGELKLIEGLMSALADGVGGVLLVVGEQGIGKSALLREGLAGAAAEGCRVGWGAGDELRRGFALGLMAECLGEEGRAATGAAVAAAGAAAGAERLLVVANRLCAVSPLVVVAEDLQWGDDASVMVWRRLAEAVGQLPLLLVGSLRQGVGGVHVAEAVAAARADGVVAELGPLGAGEVAQLTAGLVGGVPGRHLSQVLAQAGGNPLYVGELAGALVRAGRVAVHGGVAEVTDGSGMVPVPRSLEAAISERLAGLTAEVIAVLRWAAVLGGEFSIGELGLVTGQAGTELPRLVGQAAAAGVVAEAGGRLRFRHGLIRQVLYEQIPESVREALHAQAARALAAAGAAEPVVAAHLAVASDAAGGWARDWLADHVGVLTYQAPGVAAQLLRQAMAQLSSADPRREELELALVRVAALLVHADEVERIGRPLMARTTSPDRAAETALLLADTLRRAAGRLRDAAGVLEEALARPCTSSVWRARLLSQQAVNQLSLAQWDQAARAAGHALALAERAGEVGDRWAAGYALHVLSQVEYTRRDTAGYLDFQARALAVIGDDPQTTDLRLVLLANREAILEDQDQMAEAEAAIREALALAEQVGTPRLALICTAAGDYYFETGQWDEALTVLETITEVSDDLGVAILLHGQVALIAAHRDQWQLADEHLAAVAGQALDTADQQDLAYCLLRARAMAAERVGGAASAVAVLAWCLDPAIAEGMGERHLLLPSLARAAVGVGDPATAAAAAEAAAEEAGRAPLPARTAAAAWCRGLAIADPQPLLDSAGYYQAAGRPLEQAQSLEDAAGLLAGRGDLASARQAYITAAQVYLRLGADWDLRRADAQMRQHGIRRGRTRRRTAATTGWAALTPTEAKIAALVAEGQSNPEIATELFLSRSTVQTHISHILVKLGARSRVEIARHAVQHVGSAHARP
jgi:DNA-binding CsgD family transcriptional regulator/tetratricopeptide (TPR) repeat protein